SFPVSLYRAADLAMLQAAAGKPAARATPPFQSGVSDRQLQADPVFESISSEGGRAGAELRRAVLVRGSRSHLHYPAPGPGSVAIRLAIRADRVRHFPGGVY